MHNLTDMLIPCGGQLSAKASLIELLALSEAKGPGGHEGGWREPVQGRGRSGHHHVERARRERMKRRQSFGDQIVMGRECVPGERFPVGQQGDP